MSIKNWEHFFKPEVRTSGHRFLMTGQVSIKQPSDTEVLGYVKASSGFKVSLVSSSVASPILTADCSCPPSRKGQFCKHIWATLLATEKKFSDFLDEKNELQKKNTQNENSENQSATGQISNSKIKPKIQKLSESQLVSKAAYKEKQVEFRKLKYQKQKQQLKDRKKSKQSKNIVISALPGKVEIALTYFSTNGFPLDNPPKVEAIQHAKKKLSRVFHPDIGGSHSEIVELNRNCEILLDFIESTKK